MRISICAIGRLRSGPEQALVADYLDRFAKTGRALGLGPAEITQIDERKCGSMAAEARLLRKAIPEGAYVLALDERGKAMSSPQFAAFLARQRDDGRRRLAIVIGGADGLEPALRNSADRQLSLGPMVWPHKLVRVMLTEQLYRAATILAGSPYHRA